MSGIRKLLEVILRGGREVKSQAAQEAAEMAEKLAASQEEVAEKAWRLEASREEAERLRTNADDECKLHLEYQGKYLELLKIYRNFESLIKELSSLKGEEISSRRVVHAIERAMDPEHKGSVDGIWWASDYCLCKSCSDWRQGRRGQQKMQIRGQKPAEARR